MSVDPKKDESVQAPQVETPDHVGNQTPMPADLEAVLREAEDYAEGKPSTPTSAAKEPDQVQSPSEQVSAAEHAELRAQVEKLKSELAAAQVKVEQSHESVLRARADLDNARRRFDRDQKEATKYAAEKTLKGLFPVIDDLDLTISNISPEADAQLAEGVRLVHRKFLQALESQGVKSFYPEGETFDPTVHEALMEQASAEHEPGTIVQVFQRGWSLNERLLRAAKVIIAKAP